MRTYGGLEIDVVLVVDHKVENQLMSKSAFVGKVLEPQDPDPVFSGIYLMFILCSHKACQVLTISYCCCKSHCSRA